MATNYVEPLCENSILRNIKNKMLLVNEVNKREKLVLITQIFNLLCLPEMTYCLSIHTKLRNILKNKCSEFFNSIADDSSELYIAEYEFLKQSMNKLEEILGSLNEHK